MDGLLAHRNVANQKSMATIIAVATRSAAMMNRRKSLAYPKRMRANDSKWPRAVRRCPFLIAPDRFEA